MIENKIAVDSEGPAEAGAVLTLYDDASERFITGTIGARVED